MLGLHGVWPSDWCNASPVTEGRDRPPIGARFSVTQEHLMLLRQAHTGWQTDGMFAAPEIHTKMPYGGLSGLQSVANALGMDVWSLNTEQLAHCRRLHRETEFCLQILLQHLAIEPRIYGNMATAAHHPPKWVLIVETMAQPRELDHNPRMDPRVGDVLVAHTRTIRRLLVHTRDGDMLQVRIMDPDGTIREESRTLEEWRSQTVYCTVLPPTQAASFRAVMMFSSLLQAG